MVLPCHRTPRCFPSNVDTSHTCQLTSTLLVQSIHIPHPHYSSPPTMSLSANLIIPSSKAYCQTSTATEALYDYTRNQTLCRTSPAAATCALAQTATATTPARLCPLSPFFLSLTNLPLIEMHTARHSTTPATATRIGGAYANIATSTLVQDVR
jgi:hypothetical protein